MCVRALTGSRFVAGGKYEPVLVDNAYKIQMRLTISSVSPSDYGSYKCVSRNSLGDTDGSIKVYRKYNRAIIPGESSHSGKKRDRAPAISARPDRPRAITAGTDFSANEP